MKREWCKLKKKMCYIHNDDNVCCVCIYVEKVRGCGLLNKMYIHYKSKQKHTHTHDII